RMTNLGTVADLKIYNNYWADMGSGSDEVALCHGDVQVKAYLFGGEAGYPTIPGWNNNITDLSIAYGSRTPYAYDMYPVPTTGFEGFTWANPNSADTAVGYHPEMAATVGDTIQLPDCWGNFEVVDYPGAFEPGTKATYIWIRGWTALDQYGYLDPNPNLTCCQLRGDAKHNGGVLVDDLVFLVNYIFKGSMIPPSCAEEGDAKANGGILVDDLVFLVNYIFKGSMLPPPAC
ncbi:MAG: hypothetical protein ABIJ12_02120, partial [bacterium]